VRRRWLLVSVALLALALLAGRVLSGWYVDYHWYASQGAQRLWLARATDLLLLRGAAFVAGFLFALANLLAVRHSVHSLRLPRRIGNIDFSEEVSDRILNATALAMAIFLGVVLAMPHDDWLSVELIRHGQRFGETDPYFQLDLATWLYHIPLESSVHLWAMVALIGMTLLVTFLYALTPSLRWEQGALYVSGYVRRHLFMLGAVLLLLMAWGYRLDAYGLLHQGTGPLGALSAIDHRVGIPSNLILAMIAVASAMLVAWAGWTGQVRVAFVTLTIMLLSALTVRQVVPTVAGRFVTSPDAESQEQSYREIRNGYTRRAFAVDEVVPVTPGQRTLALDDALGGASLWDGEALRRAMSSSRPGGRQNGALSWEGQDGRLVAFALQEPAGQAAEGGAAGWGLERVAADVTDDRGAPVARDHPELSASQPLLGVYVFDSASAWQSLLDTGAVAAGRPIVSLIDRVAHAWHLQNLALLRRDPGEPPARVVLRQDVQQRLQHLYPFFVQESRVAPLVWRDTVYWAVHLYDASDWYPLSTPYRVGTRSVRYQRLAAIGLVNALTGRVTAIPHARPGPMMATWLARFPELFTDGATFDAGLLLKVPPPSDGAWLVAQALAQAGLRGEFEARGRLPVQMIDSLFGRASLPPFLDRSTGALALSLPILEPTDEVRGLLVATGGPDVQFQWERWEERGPKWGRIVADLQVAVDSLPGNEAARPLPGAVRLVPSAAGPAALQTHYTVRPDGDMSVHVAAIRHGDSVFTGRTLFEAAGMPNPVETVEPLTPEEFRRRVAALYDAMREAMRRGDWAGIGATWDALGRLLRAARQP
jgi:hypothetical protein